MPWVTKYLGLQQNLKKKIKFGLLSSFDHFNSDSVGCIMPHHVLDSCKQLAMPIFFPLIFASSISTIHELKIYFLLNLDKVILVWSKLDETSTVITSVFCLTVPAPKPEKNMKIFNLSASLSHPTLGLLRFGFVFFLPIWIIILCSSMCRSSSWFKQNLVFFQSE